MILTTKILRKASQVDLLTALGAPEPPARPGEPSAVRETAPPRARDGAFGKEFENAASATKSKENLSGPKETSRLQTDPNAGSKPDHAKAAEKPDQKSARADDPADAPANTPSRRIRLEAASEALSAAIKARFASAENPLANNQDAAVPAKTKGAEKNKATTLKGEQGAAGPDKNSLVSTSRMAGAPESVDKEAAIAAARKTIETALAGTDKTKSPRFDEKLPGDTPPAKDGEKAKAAPEAGASVAPPSIAPLQIHAGAQTKTDATEKSGVSPTHALGAADKPIGALTTLMSLKQDGPADSVKKTPIPAALQAAAQAAKPAGDNTLPPDVAAAVNALAPSQAQNVPAPATPQHPNAAPAAPAAAPDPATQVIAAIHSGHGRNDIEVRLDPPDLGSVRIHFSLDRADGVTATVTSDRGDTLNLLRRHGDDLVRELQRAGFSNVQLDFSSGGRNEFASRQQSAAQGASVIFGGAQTEDAPVIHYIRRSDSRLDRLV